jgi:hypothetical protein
MSVLYNSFVSQTAKTVFALALFFLLSISVAYAQTTRYVTPTGAGAMDGSSWANAGSDLQATINASATGDNVWVATGTYLPTQDPFGNTTPTDPRDKTFYVKDGVGIYGGFAGTETLLTQRNITANITTLSGDFNGDDSVLGSGSTLSITGNTENAYHVVLASTTVSGAGVTIDGFSIIGGHANGSGPVSVNGNNIYRYHGGGILAYRGTNTLTNNILSGNSANSYANDAGGGICAFYGTNTITNNILSRNRASYFGGGICAFYGTNTITDNNLSGNWANANGGGIGTFIGSNNTLANNTLSGNSAGYGGGIYTNNSTNTITNNTLSGNSAGWGGGIYTDISSTNTITNNTLSGNSAGNGGGIYIGNSTNTLTNNTLSGNSSGNGGGIYIDNGTNTLTNNTLSGNWATNSGGGGGGVYTNNGTNAFINNIFWGNKKGTNANILAADYFATNTNGNIFTNNLLQLATSNYPTDASLPYGIGTAASGNIFAQDPLFVNAADIDGADDIHRTADDGLRLQVGSPAINVGDNAGVAATDITGAARIQDTTVDMGAYEGGVFVCPSVVTLYVDANIGASGDGQSWVTAYQTLDEALALAHCCTLVDTIKVATGTYKPTKKPYSSCDTEISLDDFGNPLTARDATFHLPDGLVLWGGYPAGGGARNSTANITTLSGDFNGDDVVTGTGATLSITNNTENAYHVVVASTPTGGTGVTVDGFAITGGNANGTSNLTVSGNAIGSDAGGAIFSTNGDITLTNNTLSANSASGKGGAVFLFSGINLLTNNTLFGNTAAFGGGIYTFFSTNTLTNNTLSGNSTLYGGGIFSQGSNNTLKNNTLSANSASAGGGGIYTYLNTSTITNCIFWDNLQNGSSTVIGADINMSSANAVTYCLTQAGSAYSTGTGIINNQDPLFVNATDIDGADNIHRTADDGLKLSCASPAYNAGTSTGAPTTDITGTTRPQLGAVDMGAYENVLPTIAITGTATACVSVSLTATGGTAYAWSGGTTPNTAGNTFTTSGTYTVTVSDANGCSATASQVVTVNPLPNAGITGATTGCGSVSLTAIGGTTYAWSGGATPNTAANTFTTSGTYTVTVTNANGCSATASQAVTVNPLPTPNITGTATACNSVSLTATGGTTYVWSGGATPNTAANTFTTSGTYTVTVSDANACSATASQVVTVNPLPTPNITGTATACNSVSLTATGGTTYAWSGGATPNMAANSFTTSGTYTVTVSDANGCSATASQVVTVNPLPTPNITGTATACNSVSLTATGGTTYAWSGGATPNTAANTFTTNSTYTVTVSDANGCSATASQAVTVNPLPTPNITGTATACNSVSLMATGGTTYTWSGGATPNTAANTFATSGTYTVTVSDANGCSATASQVVTVNPLPTPNITGTATACNSVSLTATGGTTYAWSDGATPNMAANTFTTSGTYTVTVSDANGCSATASQAVTVNPLPTPNITGTATACNSVSLTATGGTTYAWSGGATPNMAANTFTTSGTYTVTVSDANGCSATASQAVTVNPLPTPNITGTATACNSVSLTATGGTTYTWSGGATPNTAANTFTTSGTYTVTVTNTNGCSATASQVVTVNPLPTPNITGTATACNSVSLTATGGTTYAWSGGATPNTAGNTFTTSGTYTVTVTNTNGCSATASQVVTVNPLPTPNITGTATACNSVSLTATGGTTYTWSGGATPNTAANTFTTSSTYTVTVSDANACSATASQVVTVNPLPTPNITGTATACNSVSLTATGGTTYAWSGGATPNTAGNTFTTSGTYTVTVSDANGCSATASQVVTVNPLPTPNITGTATACVSVSLTATGGTTYAWSGGATPNTAANTFTTSGTYIVTVSDANACSATASQVVTVNPLPTPNITGTATACNSVSLTATGGTTYAWSGGATPNTAANTFTTNSTYTVTVSDANACSATASQAVTVNPLPTPNITGTATACNSVSLMATGGTTYTWSGGATPNTAANTFATSGTYTVTVSDANACSATASQVVTVNPLPTPNITGTATACNSVSLTATGGTTYTWSGGATPNTAANTFTTSGTYTVTVTNTNGCSATASQVVTVNPLPTPNITGTATACNSVSLTATGGTTYTWSGGATPNTAANTFTTSSTYTVTVSDANACSATASQVVTVNPLPTPNITGTATACNSVSLTATGGTTYAWSGGATPNTAANTFTTSGTYTVTVTNTNGCSATASQAVTVNPLPTPNITGTATACNSVSLTATGGTTYAWSGGATPNTAGNTFTTSGTYIVTVSDANACSATASQVVTVNPLPTPNITGTATACNSVSLTATGGTTYTWSGGATPNTAANTFATSGTYTVTVTNANGCSATASQVVTVNPLPIVDITGATTACATVSLMASGGATYLWSGGSTPSNANNTFTTSGTYTVTVTTANSCTGTSGRTITVNPLPTPNITGIATACGSVSLTAIGGTAYAWSGGATPNIAANTFTTSGAYTVTVTNSNGCSATIGQIVTVNPLPNPSITGITTACGSVSLIATGGTAYAWSGGATPATASNTFTTSGTYTVTISNTSGCRTTASQTVTVNPLPNAGITGNAMGCGSVSLTATGGTAYAWSGGATPNTAANTFATSGIYTVTVTNSNGCTATAGTNVVVNAYSTPLASITTQGGIGGVSPFVYNTETVIIYGGTTPYQFTWDNSGYVRYDILYGDIDHDNNPTTAAISGATINIFYANGAEWAVTTTSADICSSSTLNFSNTSGATNPTIPLDINSHVIAAHTSALISDGAIDISVTGGDCGGAYTYEWSGANGFTANTQDVSGLAYGWYSVTVTCGDETVQGWYWVPRQRRGRSKVEGAESLISIAPNPFSSATTIQFYSEQDGYSKMSVYTMDGREVAILFDGETAADTTYPIPFEGNYLPSGSYNIVLIDAKGQRSVERVILTK